MTFHIRILLPEDRAAFHALRLEALSLAPNAYMSTLEETLAGKVGDFNEFFTGTRDEHVMLGAFDGETLIGITGLTREPKIKRRHIAWVKSVYVKPAYRGHKLGRDLVQRAIDIARALNGIGYLQLSVESNNLAAKSIYEQLGFATWGVETPAMIADGIEYSEDYMQLKL